MKVYFIGYLISKSECYEYIGPAVSGNNYQYGFLKSLNKLLKNDLKIFTIKPMAPYPTNKKVLVGRKSKKIDEELLVQELPFINMNYLKQITTFISIVFNLSINILKNRKESIKVICYNAFPPLSSAVLFVCKILKIKSVCILADLPIDAYEYKGIKKIFNKLRIYKTKKNIKKFTGLIALNERAVKLYSEISPYVVAEGGILKEEVNKEIQTSNSDDKLVKILYSGILTEFNGVKLLIESFKKIELDNYRLIIVGNGELEEYIKKEALADKRIVYKGFLNNEKVLRLQREVTILINPRPCTRWSYDIPSFPAKLIEYMFSGTPIITTPLRDIDSNLRKLLFEVSEDTSDRISSEIIRVGSLKDNERKVIGQRMREYAIENYIWDKKIKAVNKFLASI